MVGGAFTVEDGRSAPDGLWHVGVNAFEPRATTKPVTEEVMGRLLQEWASRWTGG